MQSKQSHSLLAVTSAALAVSILVASSALAQALPQPLIEVARKAVVGNPEIQAKWREFTAAGHEHEFARSGQRPRLDLIASAGRQWTNNRPDLSTNLDYYRNGQGVTLTQMLFDGFYTRNEISRLGYAKLVRYYELLESSENITLEAMRAYADVAKQLELVEAAKANYIEHKLITQLIEERTSAGVSRGVDLEQATGRLALAESNLITEISNLHDVSARYLRVVGERPGDNVPPLPERLKLRGLPASGTQAMNEGLPSSPTINAAYENVRSAKAQVESNKSGYYPRLDFRAGQNWSNNYAGTAGSWTDAYAELALNYNLYRGGADMAREKQAIELRYQARDLQEKACRDVRQNLIIAYNDLTRLLDQLNFLDQHRLSTEKARQAYRQQFEIGQRTLLDMLNTQNEYFEASRAYTSARYNQIMAQARTLAGMGRLTATLGVTRPDQPTASDAGQDRGELPPDELCPFEAPPVRTVAQLVGPMPAPVAKPAPAVEKPCDSSYLVLLPDPDGKVGTVTLKGPKGEKVLTEVNAAAALDGCGNVYKVSKEQIQRDFGQAIAAQPAPPEQFMLYFENGKEVLTKASEGELPRVMERVRARQTADMSVTGHTDTVGSFKSNDALGLRRANVVAKQMRALGMPNLAMTVESLGERNLLIPTPDNTPEPRNRRVEITVR